MAGFADLFESIKRSGGGVSEQGKRTVDSLRESIKRSGGGVSEQDAQQDSHRAGVYQAFRWWGVGTAYHVGSPYLLSLSSVPVVGCRNLEACVRPPL